jgi:hypothetical protein
MKFKLGPAAVGIKVAKDFTNGVWFGEVTKHDDEPDEDGDDADGGIYTILYTDGDGEDWEEHEYTYGVSLWMLMNPKKANGCEAAGNKTNQALLDALEPALRADVMKKMATEIPKQANKTAKKALLDATDRERCLEEDAAELQAQAEDVSGVFSSPPPKVNVALVLLCPPPPLLPCPPLHLPPPPLTT